MEHASTQIAPCPPERRAEALSLVLCDLAPSQRRDIVRGLRNNPEADRELAGGLFVALRGETLCGAVWGQLQSGNTAVLWPPQLVLGVGEQTAYRLAETAVRGLDRAAVGMAQVLLPIQDTTHIAVLSSVGFRHLANLVYLSCEAERFAAHAADETNDLQFVSYDESQRDRLARVIERTYEDTLDCAELNGRRPLDEVIDGYQATGEFHAEHWLIVRDGRHDVGVVLLAAHPEARHWELMYMGVVPEARGRGWGRKIVHLAQDLARRARVERIVLAVDEVNEPALRIYRSAGFEVWDGRAVFVRFKR
jgi:ribosomal protein S18 acetylase RimI-like enzyme